MKVKKRKEKITFALYVKNFIFGVEDSLVSTVGLLSGIAVAGVSKSVILVSGIVLIFVEAFSMGVGSLLSEHTAEEYLNKRNTHLSRRVTLAGMIMFFSYFVTGFIPLAPYLFFERPQAFVISIVLALIALFLLGLLSGRVFKISVWHKSFEMLLIGGGAVVVGVLVGLLVDKLLV